MRQPGILYQCVWDGGGEQPTFSRKVLGQNQCVPPFVTPCLLAENFSKFLSSDEKGVSSLGEGGG